MSCIETVPSGFDITDPVVYAERTAEWLGTKLALTSMGPSADDKLLTGTMAKVLG